MKNVILIHEDLEFNRVVYHFENDNEITYTSIETFEKCFLNNNSLNFFNVIINLINLENFESYKKNLCKL